MDSFGRFAQWCMRLCTFDFDVEHRAGFKHQAADALLRLITTGQDESSLEDDLPLYAIDSHDSLPRFVHAIAHDVDRCQNVPDTSSSEDKVELAPTTTLEIIRAQQQGISCRVAATLVEQRNCKLTMHQKSLLSARPTSKTQSKLCNLYFYGSSC